jgi:hypothetical protein
MTQPACEKVMGTTNEPKEGDEKNASKKVKKNKERGG